MLSTKETVINSELGVKPTLYVLRGLFFSAKFSEPFLLANLLFGGSDKSEETVGGRIANRKCFGHFK
jgi:hypothetical protein